MTTSTKSTVKKATEIAAKGSKKPAVLTPVPKQPVYFFGAGCGSFVLDSPDTARIPLGDGTYDKVKVPAVEVPFGPDGVSPPYDEDNPDHAELIKRARGHIRDVAEGRVIDDRVGLYKFRELAPFAPTPPFDKWDVTSWAKLPAIVEALGYDVQKCIEYERSRGSEARYELVDALEAMAATPDDDPFASVEV